MREVVRHDSPVQNTRRFLAEDAVVAGQALRTGDTVLVVLAAANRDPSVNPEPDRFDPARREREAYTFGLGVHACPGEALASTIAEAGVAALLAAGVEPARLIESVRYRPVGQHARPAVRSRAVSWDVRPCDSPQEFRDALSNIWHYFGRTAPRDDQVASLAPVLPAERVHAARDQGRIVGGAGVFPFLMTVPGGRLRAAGVTVVGVLPTHRRRGVLTAMMRAQIDDCHARGESVAYLWPSEDRIYGRFGYGMASLTGEIDVAREHVAFREPPESFGQARLVRADRGRAAGGAGVGARRGGRARDVRAHGGVVEGAGAHRSRLAPRRRW